MSDIKLDSTIIEQHQKSFIQFDDVVHAREECF